MKNIINKICKRIKRRRYKKFCKERLCCDCKYAEHSGERTLEINGQKTVFDTYVCSLEIGGEYRVRTETE